MAIGSGHVFLTSDYDLQELINVPSLESVKMVNVTSQEQGSLVSVAVVTNSPLIREHAQVCLGAS